MREARDEGAYGRATRCGRQEGVRAARHFPCFAAISWGLCLHTNCSCGEHDSLWPGEEDLREQLACSSADSSTLHRGTEPRVYDF